MRYACTEQRAANSSRKDGGRIRCLDRLNFEGMMTCERFLVFLGLFLAISVVVTAFFLMVNWGLAEKQPKKPITGDTSDGYHTFNELYEHRNLLFLAFCLTDSYPGLTHGAVYWVQDHFDGWDLVATTVDKQQISYHLQKKYRPILQKHFNKVHTLESVFDGHTSKDVIERLLGAITKL